MVWGKPGAVTTTETVPLAPAARSPIAQVTLSAAKVPPLVALTKVAPAGIGSTS